MATALLMTANGIAASTASGVAKPSRKWNIMPKPASVAAKPRSDAVAAVTMSPRRSRVTVRSSAPSSTIRMRPIVPITGTTGSTQW